MITPEMYQVFDRVVANRRMYYGKLNNALLQMTDLLLMLRKAMESGGQLDLALRDRDWTYWIALTRPGMPDPGLNFPRRDLALIEYLSEWACGVKYHATAEIMEMDFRYPELRSLKSSDLMPASMTYVSPEAGNCLKRAFKSIFK
jgi:hypothetical protein